MTIKAKSRRIVGMLAAMAVASGVMLGIGVESASAAPPVVLVSTDGVTYSPNLSVGLFDGIGLLVPGDTATADLWIKNPTADPATVRLSVGQVTASDAELAENMTLQALNTASHTSVTRVWNDLAQCDIMVASQTIAGGAVLRVVLTLTMLNATGLQAQHQDASMNAVVEMRDDAAGAFPSSTCDPATTDPGTTNPAGTTPSTHHSTSGSPLAFTGEDFPTQLLILACVMIGTGWFFLALRRRLRREEGES